MLTWICNDKACASWKLKELVRVLVLLSQLDARTQLPSVQPLTLTYLSHMLDDLGIDVYYVSLDSEKLR